MTRTGRPPIDPEKRRSAPIPVRFTDSERELVEDAAAADGMSLSTWIRARAVAAAKRANRKPLQ
ncbi:plasmid mobilization protein [Mycobacterium sp.]|uniref:plasmid mobilization protein n=1 Tax=Mycobacterium sp. TaxID=1785 RepID=UPI003C746489